MPDNLKSIVGTYVCDRIWSIGITINIIDYFELFIVDYYSNDKSCI